MSDTLFGEDQSPAIETEDNQDQAQTPSFNVPDSVKELIGEGKKYATIEQALASIAHAQQHIQTLEKENAQYKQQGSVNEKIEALLNKLNTSDSPAPVATPQQLNVGDIVKAVKEDLKQEATVAQRNENRALVEAKMTEAFGEKAPEETYKAAKKLGMSIEALTTLAETSPTAALQLIGVAPQHSNAKPEGDLRSGIPPIGEKPKPKPVMFGAKHSEIIDAWRASAPQS